MAEKKRKESAEDIQAAKAQHKAMISIDKDALFDRLVNGPSAGDSNAPSGFVDPNAARKERMLQVTGKADGPMDCHMDWNSVLSTVAGARGGKVATGSSRGGKTTLAFQNQNTISIALQNRAVEQFSPVVDELARFKFASDDEKRHYQMAEILTALKSVVRKMAVKEVVANTKTLYPNADRFFQTDKGIKVVFKVAQPTGMAVKLAASKVVVTAEGDFCGDEIVCLEQDGATVTPYVARQNNGGFEDLTSNYDIKIEPSN